MEATSRMKRSIRTRRGVTIRVVVIVVGLLFLASPLMGGSLNVLSLTTQAAIYAAVAVSLDLVWGYGGILDLGHAAWFGIGALGVGMMTTRLSPTAVVVAIDHSLSSHVLGLLLGIVLALVLAGIVAWFAFSSGRQSAFYIATITLALSVTAGTVYMELPQLTGGEAGLFGFTVGGLDPRSTYALALFCLAIVVCVVWVLTRSDFGVLVRAVRDNDIRVGYLGFNAALVKGIVFLTGAGLAAFAGAIYGWTIGLISPSTFEFQMATNILIWVAIGGRATIVGPILGAAVITIGSAQLNASIPDLWELLVGILLVVVIAFLPRGIFAPLVDLFRRFLRLDRQSFTRSISARELISTADTSSRVALSMQGFSFGYGARKVLTDVSVDFVAGELLAMIGPNGAGKSSMLTSLTDGRLKHGGVVRFGPTGAEIKRLPPHLLARRGLVRKFQSPALFPTLTVAETIMLAGRGGRLPSVWRRTRSVPVSASVYQIVQAMGLENHLNDRADELAHGQKQGLELAVTVMARPQVLLLDEPTAGLTGVERAAVGEILKSLVTDVGLALVLIEHDLDFVRSIADRVVVLARGHVIESGAPEEVSRSQTVRELYSGEVGIGAT